MTEAARTNPQGLKQRMKNTSEVLTGSELHELEDGYALRFPNGGGWPEKLDVFTESWRASCPQMTFDVSEADGGLRLEIRGPEGTKQFVEGSRYILGSHLNPAPTFGNKVKQGVRLLTAPLRVLPDFLIIGAKKCGTTALYSFLTQHPAVLPAFRKENYYFSALWSNGRLWYRSMFPTTGEMRHATRATGERAQTGEATPDYLFYSHAAKRAHDTVPDAKLIAILRDPVDRAYSFYNHNLRAGVEDLPFAEAIEREEERLAGEEEKVRADPGYFSFHWEHHSYLKRGVYVDQLADWTARYPKAQILVLRTEDLNQDPEGVLRRTFDFLGLSYAAPAAFKKLNAAPPYLPLDPALRAKLEAYFEPHNERLSEFLGTRMAW